MFKKWIFKPRQVDFLAIFLLLFCKCQGLTEEFFDKEIEATEEIGIFKVKNMV